MGNEQPNEKPDGRGAHGRTQQRDEGSKFAPKPGALPKPQKDPIEREMRKALKDLRQLVADRGASHETRTRARIELNRLLGLRPKVNVTEDAAEVERRIRKKTDDFLARERLDLKSLSNEGLAAKAIAVAATLVWGVAKKLPDAERATVIAKAVTDFASAVQS